MNNYASKMRKNGAYSLSVALRMMLVAPMVKRVPSSMIRRSFGESSTLSTNVPVLLLLSLRVYRSPPCLSLETVIVQWFRSTLGSTVSKVQLAGFPFW